jgi:hypothetical protein
MRPWWVIAFVIVLCNRAAAEDEDNDERAQDAVQDIVPEEPAPPPKPAPAPTPVAHSHPVHTMDEVAVPTSFLRFGINFFGDTSFLVTTPDRPHSVFAVGALGVRLLGQLSPSLDALAELAFEITEGEPLADIEQVAIRWRAGRGVLELGRLHTDLGFWNRAYHHGLWLQTPIERPQALRFEDDGGIIPVHWVGAHYTLGVTDQFAAVVGLGNGRGDIVDDILTNSETNDGKSVLIKLRYKTTLGEVGLSAIYDLIAPADAMIRPALPDESIHELIGNAYVAIRGDGPIVIGEGYAIRHQASDASWLTYSAYGLVGYTIAERVTPYAAIDTIIGADDDPFFRPDPAMSPSIDFVEVLVGIRVDVSTWSAVKLELRLDHPLDDSNNNDYTGVLNWSFGL